MVGRVQKSIINAKVNMIFYVITAILAFFSRRIFLDNLGTEFLGLSSTLGDILNLMNITELGIGTAVGITLYKPLYNGEKGKINDIISVYGFLYSRIGLFIGLLSIVLSVFFPLFFRNITIPLWLVYFLYFSMVYGALLGYFVNYKQIILSASQNNYVIIYRYNTITVIKTLLQMFLSFLPYNVIWWIGLEIVATTINSIVLIYSVRRYYPWLDTSVDHGKNIFSDYKDLWLKTKQVFVFKISHLIFNGSINILIGIFSSLSMVTIYGNYNMLMSKVTALFDGLFVGMGASIGNLIAENNKGKLMNVFYQLLSLRYFIAGLCSIVLYFTVPKLIVLWLGNQYVMEQKILVLMSMHIFILQARLCVTNFKDAYGLFQDVWAPISEVCISIIFSLILGHHYGLIGILFSFALADFLIKMCWQPFYLFKYGFKESIISSYFPYFFKYIVLLLLTFGFVWLLNHYYLTRIDFSSVFGVLFYVFVIGILVLIVLLVLFLCTDNAFRSLIRRFYGYRKS